MAMMGQRHKTRHLNPKTALLCPKLKRLMVSTHSLTKELEQLACDNIGVWVCQESFLPITPSQRHKLKLPMRPQLAWVRQVYLYDKAIQNQRGEFSVNDDTAWIKACSIVPLISLKQDGLRLKRLKDKPMGYVIFKKNRTTIATRDFSYQHNCPTRQTLYQWQGKMILLEEIFLPSLQQRLKLIP